jgi:hypothetical protein
MLRGAHEGVPCSRAKREIKGGVLTDGCDDPCPAAEIELRACGTISATPK